MLSIWRTHRDNRVADFTAILSHCGDGVAAHVNGASDAAADGSGVGSQGARRKLGAQRADTTTVTIRAASKAVTGKWSCQIN